MKPKVITNAQALELKWFCRNVASVSVELHKVKDTLRIVKEFEDKIRRLEKTCSLIEKYLGEPIEPFVSPWTQARGRNE